MLPLNLRRRRRAKAQPHTPTNGKHARSDSDHSPPRDYTPDAGAHKDEPADDTGPAGDNDLVLYPPKQEPSSSMQVDMENFDWRADTPPPEPNNSPSPAQQDSEDKWGSQHTHDPESGKDNGRQCYGWLAVMSDVDNGGVCPECRQRKGSSAVL
jgi:hypothetical protein